MGVGSRLVGDWDGTGDAGAGALRPADVDVLPDEFSGDRLCSAYLRLRTARAQAGSRWWAIGTARDRRRRAVDPITSTFYLTSSLATGIRTIHLRFRSASGRRATAGGHWDGAGRRRGPCTTRRPRSFYLTSSLATAPAQYTFGYGQPNGGWQPLVKGTGTARSGVGLYDPQATRCST